MVLNLSLGLFFLEKTSMAKMNDGFKDNVVPFVLLQVVAFLSYYGVECFDTKSRKNNL
jgi:hypothetical protein